MNNRKRDKDNKVSSIFTKETLGMTLMLFSAIVILMLLTGRAVFAGVGGAICTFLYGTFGYGSYFVIGLVAYLGERLTFGKKIKISLKTALVISLAVFVAFLLFHAVSSRNISLSSYGGYIERCYKNAAQGYSGYTFGGVISAIVVYPFAKFTTFIGAYVIFSILTLACGYLIYRVLCGGRGIRIIGARKSVNGTKIVKNANTAEEEAAPTQPQRELESEVPLDQMYEQNGIYVPQGRAPERVQQYEEPENSYQYDDKYSKENLGRKILFENGEFAAESYRRNMIFNENSYFNHPVKSDDSYLSNFSDGKNNKKPNSVPVQQTYSESFQEEVLSQPAASVPPSYVFGDKPVENLDDYASETGDVYSVQPHEDVLSEPVSEIDEAQYFQNDEPEEIYEAPAEETPYVEREEYRLNTPVVRAEEVIKPVEEKPAEQAPEVKAEQPKPSEQPKESRPVNMYDLFGAGIARTENRIEPDTSRLSERRAERSRANLFEYEDDDDDLEEIESQFSSLAHTSHVEEDYDDDDDEPSVTSPRAEQTATPYESKAESKPAAQPVTAPVKEEPVQEEKPKHVWKKYVRPTLDLLDDHPENSNVNTGEIEDNKQTIVETLARFKIASEVSNVTIGPAITRYDVIIEDKTKIKQSLNYREAVAMALMKENVTAYLNYSKGALSIEVPNNSRTIVGIKSMLTSQKFINSKANTITFALGKNIDGNVVCPDITKMPHLLVAGTTGSGKSICLSALLVSLLYKYGPEELRFILVDPKQVEFISYDKLPHLMINEIIYEVDKAIKALNWAIKEMERRYSLFKDMTEKGTATKNLDEYNNHLPEGEEKLPKIVIILDEFGDLMLQAKKDIESRIIKLVQKARACGIHLILATQRPSVDCITGLIKSNLPTRIGFKVNSFDDSRTIFDVGGAEKLLGKGDMYFRSAENPDLSRIQGCFIDTHEVQKVTDFVKQHNETYFDQSVSDFINKVEAEEQTSVGDGGEATENEAKIDDTFIQALKYCVTSNQASVSMIQRRFPVGYIKACKIIDWMENMNYITHSEGSKPRKVILSREEFENTYGDMDD